MKRTLIFEGISYECERESKTGIDGLVQIIVVDLTTPGLKLFVTPLDHEAVSKGWQYRTRWAPAIVDENELSVMINASFFATSKSRVSFPGDYAKSSQTLISDHEVNQFHVWDNFLWFDDDLSPHLEGPGLISASTYRVARWGIGGITLLKDGAISGHHNNSEDSRTAIGIDPDRKILFMAVFEHASARAVAEYLIRHHVEDAIMLDGGDSSCLAIGSGAHGITPRMLVYPTRPLATVFGVKAPRLRSEN